MAETYGGWAGGHRSEILRSCCIGNADPIEAVQELVERVLAAYEKQGGAKHVATVIPASYGEIRKWLGDGRRPGLPDVLGLIQLAGPKDLFRLDLRDTLSRMFDPSPEQIAAAVEKKLGKTAGAAVRDAYREAAARQRPLDFDQGSGR